MKKGILLINLGTPKSPSTKDVRKYLREFLMDRRVIDIPFLNRWLLVNLIIATFRAPKSAKAYQELWTNEGSPLLIYSERIKEWFQNKYEKEVVVELGMRYQQPSIESALKKLKEKNVTDLKIIPLYPQYASSTSGSSIEKALEIINTWESIPKLEIIASFIQDDELMESYLTILAENGREYLKEKKWDKIVFSYHGVPERHIYKGCSNGHCKLDTECCKVLSDKNALCYRANCYETTRRLVRKLELKEDEYLTVFQSRLGKDPWLQPYAEPTIIDFAKKGLKNILVFSPAFVADCLETTIEIGEEYNEVFRANGGEKIQLVESWNGK